MKVEDYVCKNCGANKNGKCEVDGKLVKDSDMACSQIFNSQLDITATTPLKLDDD